MSTLPVTVKPFPSAQQTADKATPVSKDVKCKIESAEDATKSEIELSCECTICNDKSDIKLAINCE